jgi:hypothetical protein
LARKSTAVARCTVEQLMLRQTRRGERVSLSNNHRLLEPIDYLFPAEAAANYYRQLANQSAPMAAQLKPNSLH